ncbi:MAG: hypothetical protein DCC65_04425 [Planctomycetota bacterium]|nr:MAG: hypothetical protein DCC65_04425 [Planctomycetota bacterium]
MRRISGSRRVGVALCAALGMALGSGCAQLNDPWKDSSAAIDADMTTPSTNAYESKPGTSANPRRTWESSNVTYANGVVTHWPLWWEDPFEDKGNRDKPPADGNESAPDNVFAWNWVDYLHMPYGPARYFLNTVGFPVSAVVTPPGTLMESDGKISKQFLGYDHDAQRSDSALREPPDVDILDRRAFIDETPTDEEFQPVEGENAPPPAGEPAPPAGVGQMVPTKS